jgi:hypothetical protein
MPATGIGKYFQNLQNIIWQAADSMQYDQKNKQLPII